ncbi:hypothetical protein PG994_002862 [Apiospora phragmitis]|uniref:Uncharacterized protein n=1 Tax=Apiospora phragmitis TaxID=2905665 RepID=A0ABR1W985_9PEZI
MNYSWHSAAQRPPNTDPCLSPAPSRNTDAAKSPCLQSHNKLHPSQIRSIATNLLLIGYRAESYIIDDPFFFVSPAPAQAFASHSLKPPPGPPCSAASRLPDPEEWMAFRLAQGPNLATAETRASMLGL